MKTLPEQGFRRPRNTGRDFSRLRRDREAFKEYIKSIPEKSTEDYTDEGLMALIVAGDDEPEAVKQRGSPLSFLWQKSHVASK